MWLQRPPSRHVEMQFDLVCKQFALCTWVSVCHISTGQLRASDSKWDTCIETECSLNPLWETIVSFLTNQPEFKPELQLETELNQQLRWLISLWVNFRILKEELFFRGSISKFSGVDSRVLRSLSYGGRAIVALLLLQSTVESIAPKRPTAELFAVSIASS